MHRGVLHGVMSPAAGLIAPLIGRRTGSKGIGFFAAFPKLKSKCR